MKKQDQIILIRYKDGWKAKYVGNYARQIKKLFGTDELPTAFTQYADAETVRQEIQRLNPNVYVTVA